MNKKKPTKKDVFASRSVSLYLPQRGKQLLPAGEAIKIALQWKKHGHYIPVIQLMTELTQLLPAYQTAWLLLFDAINQHGDMLLLKQESERCLKNKPRFIPALVNFSISQRILNQHDSALMYLQKAVKLEPSNSEIHNHIGVTLKEMGRHDEANKSFQRCIAINPSHTGAIWNRADLIGQLDDAEYERCERLIKKTDSAKEKAILHYALSRSDENKEDFDSEFNHIHQGASLMRSLVQYDHQFELQQIKNVQKEFTKKAINADACSVKTAPELAKVPIFICGLPRSGTTLTEQILSSHSQVTAGDELHDLPKACEKLLRSKDISKPFPMWSNDLNDDDWRKIEDDYLSSTKFLQKKSHFTDKNLLNYKAIGIIQRAFSQAKIIVCRRAPMDTIWGCYRQFFSEGLVFTYNLEEMADLWEASDELIQHWIKIGIPLFVLDYEELIRDPEKTIRALVDYVGLDWEDNCLNFHNNKRAVRTLSSAQVRKPLSDARIERWKRYEKHLVKVEDIVNKARV